MHAAVVVDESEQDGVSEEKIPLYLESENDYDENEHEHEHVRDHPSSAQRSVGLALLLLRQYMLLVSTIGAWYFTNGMNGIAMQSFSRVLAKQQTTDTDTDTDTRGFSATVAITSMVTCFQLILGALLGWFMLLIYSTLVEDSSNRSKDPRRLFSFPRNERSLAVLHGVGSIFTNLGFMYGKASLVQTLKLLEPFETLFLTKIFPSAGPSSSPSAGIISSTAVTVGAAISLLHSSSSEPHPHAIVFAIASGLTLSSRNVLQRRQHFDSPTTTATTNSETNIQSKQTQTGLKLELSLVQFTQLSLQSGIVMALVSVILHTFLLCTNPEHSEVLVGVLAHAINWRLLTWHPLYNAFSMITLGFCSALTHSILNAGKRVFAICFAIFWFGERTGLATAVSLAAVTVGGGWYAAEAKTIRVASAWTVWTKPLAAVLLLVMVFSVARLESKST
jgi:hypothetical protein